MDKITLAELEEWQRARRTFTLLDVRRAKVRETDGADIAGTEWRSPDGLFTWKDEILRDRPVVVVCAHGHELSAKAPRRRCARWDSTRATWSTVSPAGATAAGATVPLNSNEVRT